MQPPDESQLWGHSPGPGPSLWKLIAEYVPGSELSKIHTALGHFVVDMYTEVHSEAEMWCKMWQESERGGQHSSRPLSPLSPLTDPPAIKELVRAEVKMLLQTLRERASRGGRDGVELLLRYKPETVSYALGHLHSSNGDCISRGDTDNGSRPGSRCSVRSCSEDEIEAVRDKLNITDIDQVVDHLKSILVEECEMLNSLVRFFKFHSPGVTTSYLHAVALLKSMRETRAEVTWLKKREFNGGGSYVNRRSIHVDYIDFMHFVLYVRNIKQRCRSQSEYEISEPSLAELRELRGVIQDELELYPSSLAASPPSLPVKELKTRIRLSAGQKASDETLQSLHSSLVLRPHPPSPPCLPQPRPPVGSRLNKTSASSKPVLTPSLSRTYGQHRSTVLSSKLSRTPVCSKLTPLGQVNSHSPLISDQIMVNRKHHCGLSPERDSTGLHHRPWTSTFNFQTQPQRNLPISGDDPSSHHSIIHSLSSECDPSAQRERQSFSVSKSRNNSIPTSLIPALSHRSGFRNGSIDHSGLTTGESEVLNGQRKCTGVVSSLQEDNDRAKTISERSHSFVMSELGSPSDRDSKSHIDGNKSSHFRKDLIQQQSLRSCCCLTDLSSHHSDSGFEQEQAKCSPSVPVQFSGKCVTFPKGQVKGRLTRVHESQVESINMFYQPVPPSRVST